jgi:hypothetical protein
MIIVAALDGSSAGSAEDRVVSTVMENRGGIITESMVALKLRAAQNTIHT